MRKTVAKRLRKEALRKIGPETKRTGFITRYFTGKKDSMGNLRTIDHTTIICSGHRRAYQDLKKVYRARRSA